MLCMQGMYNDLLANLERRSLNITALYLIPLLFHVELSFIIL